MPLSWREEYAVGIQRIDDQHREIFARIGNLFHGLQQGQGSEELRRTFAFLEEYTQTHFRDEEELMAASRYVLLPQHRAEHQALIRQLAVWRAGVDQADLRLILQAATMLGEWLRRHIAGSDQALARVVQGRQEAA